MNSNQKWRFYVYEVLCASGSVLYIGKGSGRRGASSMRQRGGSTWREVARFKREGDAYRFERERIAGVCPPLNRHPGGNGSMATPVRAQREPKWVHEIRAVGTRVYAARKWLDFYFGCLAAGTRFPGDASKVEAIRRVAYG